MNVQIDRTIRRARAYWFVDGFTEMAAGGFFSLLALLLLVGGYASPDTFSSWFLSMAGEIAAAKIAGILIVVLILWWLKDHFTYPRTGFVRGKRISGALLLVMLRNVVLFLLLPILGLLLASVLIASAGSVLASMPVWYPISIGLLWAGLLVMAGRWMGLGRFRVLGGLIVLSGIAIGLWQLASGLPTLALNLRSDLLQPAVVESINRTLNSLSLLVLITGVILALSGLITVLRYRKENPAPYTEEG